MLSGCSHQDPEQYHQSHQLLLVRHKCILGARIPATTLLFSDSPFPASEEFLIPSLNAQKQFLSTAWTVTFFVLFEFVIFLPLPPSANPTGVCHHNLALFS